MYPTWTILTKYFLLQPHPTALVLFHRIPGSLSNCSHLSPPISPSDIQASTPPIQMDPSTSAVQGLSSRFPHYHHFTPKKTELNFYSLCMVYVVYLFCYNFENYANLSLITTFSFYYKPKKSIVLFKNRKIHDWR